MVLPSLLNLGHRDSGTGSARIVSTYIVSLQLFPNSGLPELRGRKIAKDIRCYILCNNCKVSRIIVSWIVQVEILRTCDNRLYMTKGRLRMCSRLQTLRWRDYPRSFGHNLNVCVLKSKESFPEAVRGTLKEEAQRDGKGRKNCVQFLVLRWRVLCEKTGERPLGRSCLPLMLARKHRPQSYNWT